MTAASGLLKRCWENMTYEPIEFIRDADGTTHFASGSLPYKTIICVHDLNFRWIKPDESRGLVEIELDGRKIVYERTGVGPHGEWLCTLRIAPPDAD